MNSSDAQEYERHLLEEEGRNPNTEVDAPKQSGKKPSMTTSLIALASTGTTMFHDADGTGYISIPKDGCGVSILPIIGTALKYYLSERYFTLHGRAISDRAFKEAIGVLNGNAIFRGAETKLSNRVAWRDGGICYDMTNVRHEEVVIDGSGWRMQNSTSPTFKRHPHQSAQVEPTMGRAIEEIFSIINVVPEDKLLTLVHIVSSLVPDIPHPMIVLGGEQGSAKSSASKVLKALIDPSVIDTVAMPRAADRMHQVLSKHWYLMFDNVSWIEPWQSDLFCRAVTGQADVTREYFTTSDDHIFSYKMCLGMNGITSIVTSSDLLDRTLSIRLSPIPDSKRKGEEEVNSMFEDMRGEILGSIFTVLADAINIYPTVSMKELPRMADFARWGCAISEALGYTQKDFMDAYNRKIEYANEDALEATPVAGLIIRLMETRDVWRGTTKELREALTDFVVEDGMAPRDIRGMKSVNALGMTRERILPNLRRFGIDWKKEDRTSTRRGYIIEKHPINGGSQSKICGNLTTCDDLPLCVPSNSNIRGETVGNTLGGGRHGLTQPSAPSKRDDFDTVVADRIRKAISEATGKPPSIDGVCVEDISRESGLPKAVINKYLTKYINKMNIGSLGNGLYMMRTI